MDNSKPLAIELFAGLSGWASGFLAEGYRVIGFDLHDMCKQTRTPHPEGDFQLVLQDVATLHGSQFRDAAVIVASPPCQAYSYRAMPWKRAKALPPPDNTLFEACFRIQREASETAGRYIPMVVENVKGAQPWVGRARWHWGSYYLWGDVPALMPFTYSGRKNTGGSWYAVANNTTSGHSQNPVNGIKVPGMNFRDYEKTGKPGRSFQLAAVESTFGWDRQSRLRCNSAARKQASAEIAKIPFELAQHIARVFKPRLTEKTA